MAKQPKVTKPDESSSVVALKPGIDQVPSYVLEHTGPARGISRAPEDNLIPMVAVLQPLSPQLNRQNQSKYIEGAEPGSILVRGMDPPIASELIFQHCHFSKAIVEWIPRSKGGGFAGRHITLPPDARPGTSEDGRREIMVTPTGNHLVETRYHVGHVVTPDGLLLPYIVPFVSTGHTVSKGWMNLMTSCRLADGRIPDAWTRLYRLTTVQRTNVAGVWYSLNPQPYGWATAEQAKQGEALYVAFDSGEKRYGEEETSTPEQGLAGLPSGKF